MIRDHLPGCVFLDLFAGSGAIGIEALSRGASRAYFAESDRQALDVIRQNLSFTKLTPTAIVLPMPAEHAVRTLAHREKFDCIFMDPPYNKNLEQTILQALRESDIIHADTLIIVEASLETDFSYVGTLGFTVTKEKKYKTNKHVFIKRAEP